MESYYLTEEDRRLLGVLKKGTRPVKDIVTGFGGKSADATARIQELVRYGFLVDRGNRCYALTSKGRSAIN